MSADDLDRLTPEKARAVIPHMSREERLALMDEIIEVEVADRERKRAERAAARAARPAKPQEPVWSRYSRRVVLDAKKVRDDIDRLRRGGREREAAQAETTLREHLDEAQMHLAVVPDDASGLLA